jgi:hypothetical protein
VAGGEFGTDVEGLQGMGGSVSSSHDTLYPRGGWARQSLMEFLPSSDRPPQEILNGLGLCQRQHTCGVEVKILFKTWQVRDEAEFDPLE